MKIWPPTDQGHSLKPWSDWIQARLILEPALKAYSYLSRSFVLNTYPKESKVTQSCLTLCDLIDCSLTISWVHGIFQARILEWVAIAFSRRSSQTRDWTWVSRIVGRRFTVWTTREVSIFTLPPYQFRVNNNDNNNSSSNNNSYHLLSTYSTVCQALC